MSRICPLYSGSTGNSTYIGTLDGGILVDAGASFKGLCNALERAGGSYDEIKAIAVTHEHTDHIKGLKVFLNKTNAALVASKGTLIEYFKRFESKFFKELPSILISDKLLFEDFALVVVVVF